VSVALAARAVQPRSTTCRDRPPAPVAYLLACTHRCRCRRYIRNSFWQTLKAIGCVMSHSVSEAAAKHFYCVACKRQSAACRCCADVQELLAYGTADGLLGAYVPFVPPVENGKASVVSAASTTVVHEAMFGDACSFLAARPPPGFNVTKCQYTGSGIFTHGLMAAMQVREF